MSTIRQAFMKKLNSHSPLFREHVTTRSLKKGGFWVLVSNQIIVQVNAAEEIEAACQKVIETFRIIAKDPSAWERKVESNRRKHLEYLRRQEEAQKERTGSCQHPVPSPTDLQGKSK